MENKKKTKRQIRRAARVISYVTALVLVLSGLALTNFVKAARYERYLENSYQRAFAELSSNLDGLNTSLKKSIYVTSPKLLSALCTDIYGKAMTAQMSLEALPYSNIPLENTSGFIAKVGDYAYSLSRRAATGEAFTKEDFDTLNSLYKTSSQLSDKLTQTQADIYARNLSLNDEAKPEELMLKEEGDSDSVSNTIQTTENDFPEMPSLIYDGPFNEHIEKQEPIYLKGRDEVTQEEAAAKVAKFLSVKQADLTYEGESISKRISTWRYSCPLRNSILYVQAAKLGGEVLTTYGSFDTGEAALSREQVIDKASNFLRENGYEDMTVTYTQREDDTMLVNYAAMQSNVILYPDLVKVRVAMDDGAILGFEAAGYFMSHKEREIPAATIDEKMATQKASPALKVLSSDLCIIPTAGGNEIFCRELKCETSEGSHCLLYINAETGAEEKLLLLIEDENGTLTIQLKTNQYEIAPFVGSCRQKAHSVFETITVLSG